jgi:Zn-dependent protease with chaperone function
VTASVWLLLAATATIAGVLTRRRLDGHRPERTALVLITTGGAIATAFVAALTLLAVGWLSHVPAVAKLLFWCGPLALRHDGVASPLGVAALAWLVIGAARAWRATRWHRSLIVRGAPGSTPAVTVVHDDRPRAFALPGKPGQIVLSTGMLDALSEPEHQALLAHERAHLRHHHPSLLLAADLIVAVMPLLWRLHKRILFAIERWADEAAARELGERTIVAKAVAHAALAESTPGRREHALAIADLGVPARVEALLTPRRSRTVGFQALAAAFLTAAAIAGSGALRQAHHLAPLIGLHC